MMHQRVSANGICMMARPLREQTAAWAALGFQRISLVGLQIENEGPAAAREAMGAGDFALETIVHTFLVGEHLAADKARWQKPRDRLAAQIEVAHTLGAKSIYMTTGGRGDLNWQNAAEVFAEMVAPGREAARAAGIALMVENAPPVYADIHIALSLRDTIRLAEQADIGVCIDIFSCWTEADLHDSIRQAASRCDLVQISDYVYGDRALPARAVTGDGNIPLRAIMAVLLDAGYGGAFDLELLGPRIDAEGNAAATERAGRWVSDQLQQLGA